MTKKDICGLKIRLEKNQCVVSLGKKGDTCVQNDVERLYIYQTLIASLFVQIVNYF